MTDGKGADREMGGPGRQTEGLKDRRFGHLVATGPAEPIDGRSAWTCRCDCGKVLSVRTYHLLSGHTRSCGCRTGTGRRAPGLGLTYVDGTCVEMLAAGTVRRNNTSGVPGVEFLAAEGKWRATLCFQGRRRYLGRYGTFDEAAAARRKAEEELVLPFLEEHASHKA